MKTRYLFALLFALAPVCSHALADAVLRPGDSFELKIAGVPTDDTGKISGTLTIDGEGYINLAYIGKVQAGGRTPSDVQSAVERAYVNGGFFTHPTISINIAAQSRLVTVGGEVNSRGRVPYTPDMTVMSAIGAAGDFTIYANQAKVRLIRGGNVKIINCKKIRGNPSLDEKVLPGDNIQVEQSIW